MVGTKQERFTRAFDYLKSHGLAHSQQDVADKMKSDKSNLSKAFKGETRFLTDKFLLYLSVSFRLLSVYFPFKSKSCKKPSDLPGLLGFL